MALYGLVAGIRGNREALDAALRALAPYEIDRLVCLGGIVGYNADPDECAQALREQRALALAGAEDLVALGRLGFQACSNREMYALKRTRRALARDTRLYLEGLPRQRALEEGVVASAGAAQHAPGVRLCLFGRSEEPKILEVNGDEVQETAFQAGYRFQPERVYYVSPGAVDAARKSGPRLAQCAVLDTGAGAIEFLSVPYDAAASEVKAVVFGYRIGRWTDRRYSALRALRRVFSLPKWGRTPFNPQIGPDPA